MTEASHYAAKRRAELMANAILALERAAGRCHRAWAAPVLVAAGWRVVLDGVEVERG